MTVSYSSWYKSWIYQNLTPHAIKTVIDKTSNLSNFLYLPFSFSSPSALFKTTRGQMWTELHIWAVLETVLLNKRRGKKIIISVNVLDASLLQIVELTAYRNSPKLGVLVIFILLVHEIFSQFSVVHFQQNRFSCYWKSIKADDFLLFIW